MCFCGAAQGLAAADQGGLRTTGRRGCVHTGDMQTLAKEAHWSYHTPAPGTILNFLCVAGSITPITDGETVTTTPGTWLSNSDSRRDPFRSAIATYS